ncbi:hypothetical protein WJX73_008944 [Symbiochloris irregularis]|uniref:Oxysterol-binding protein n=1 Tax=Symbiochloris irregularis TaxID=706552 RepID=A0AAW1NSM7_9CHLO
MAKLLKKSLRSKHWNDAPPSSSPPAFDQEDDEFHDAPEALLHPEAHEEGGIAFTNKELLDQQRGAIMEIVKDMGRKLLTGNLNLINMSLPVKMFEPRSYLEKLADVWVYPQYLEEAAKAQDSAQRMRFVVTWFIAGLQHAFQSWRKPFNPILGETWQASLVDGTNIFIEQISHHPPISAFQMVGPGAMYSFTGWSRPEVKYKGNAIKTAACGRRSVSFPDGTQIYLTFPFYYIRGIMYTSMPRAELVGTARFVDHKSRLCCEVVFGKVADSPDDPLLQRTDSFHGTLYRFTSNAQSVSSSTQAKGSRFSYVRSLVGGGGGSGSGSDEPELLCEQVLSTATGNWLSHLDWDGHRFWTLSEARPAVWGPVEAPLPSDCRFREDLRALQAGQDPREAQATKEKLENMQRNDAKLRKPHIEALLAANQGK